MLLPNSACVKGCIATLRAANVSTLHFTNTDLLKDELALDIDKSITDCRNKYTNTSALAQGAMNVSTVLPQINTTGLFGCAKENLAMLRSKYSYLQ